MVIPDPQWGPYDLWNTAITLEFFDGKSKGRPVYIDIDDTVIERIGADVGVAAGRSAQDELRDAVRRTLAPLDGPRGIFANHLDEIERWRQLGPSETPPCVALLALFVLAAERMKSDETFRAGNYYGRLADEVDLADRSELSIQRLRTQFQRYSHRFWEALRDWLLWHDGALGLPSAEAFDSRSHIGLPMSQALVRAADRSSFAELFEHYRLRPGQVIAPQDMYDMVDAWLPRAAVSRGLKRLWSRQDAAKKIAAIACLELQLWDGTSERQETGQSRTRRAPLVLSAAIGSIPRAFRLTLRPPRFGKLPLGTYELATDSPLAAREALGPCGGRVTLEQGLSGTLRLREAAHISYPDLLICTLSLRHRNGAELTRQGGRVVVFQKDEETHELLETGSIDLGADLWILAHDGLAERLRFILQQSARGGWQALTSLPGLPESWTLFRDVQLLRPPPLNETADYELQALVPASRTQIFVGGGFSLPGRNRWHIGHPPEIRLTSETDGPLEANVRTIWSPIRTQGDELLQRFTGSTVVSLAHTNLPDGDYQVLLQRSADARKASEPLVTGSFAFRSASARMPRFGETLDWIGRAAASHGIDGHFGLTARKRDESEAFALAIRGLMITGHPPAPADDHDTAGWSLSNATPEDDREVLYEDSAAQSGSTRSVPKESCIVSGIHTYVIPTYSPGRARVLREHTGVCKFCGDSQVWRRASSKHRRSSNTPSLEVAESIAIGPSVRVPPLPQPSSPSSNFPPPRLLLDALSYVRNGSFACYAGMAEQICADPWYSTESLFDLSSLGHLEFERSIDTSEIVAWAVCPPTLALQTDRGEAFLAGARSDELLEALRARCETLGLTVMLTDIPGAPPRVGISGIGPAEAQAIASTLPDVQGLKAEISIDPDLRIAEACPPLSTVLKVCPTISPASAGEARVFDPHVARWVGATSLELKRAYLVPRSPKITCFYGGNASGTARLFVSDYRVIKHVGAAAQRVLLARFDSASGTLSVPVGCRLPDLYERAAVAGSGLLPVKRDGRLIYQGVRAEVAALLVRQLSR